LSSKSSKEDEVRQHLAELGSVVEMSVRIVNEVSGSCSGCGGDCSGYGGCH